MTLEEAKQSLADYINHRWTPGSFLVAVLQNNLFEAINRADDESLENIPAIVHWIYNNVPSNVYGTKEIVRNHLEGK